MVRSTLAATASASFTFTLDAPEASLSAAGVAAGTPAASQRAPGQAAAFSPGLAETKACGPARPIPLCLSIGSCVV